MNKLSLLLTIMTGCLFFASNAQTASGYKVANKFHLGGDEKFDYLISDDAAGRLYVSHGSKVQIVDETTGKQVGVIEGMNGVHGIAIASSLNKGFISSGKDSSVVVFDIKTLQVITKITTTGKGPDAILFDPFTKKVFIFNGKSNNATVISAESNKIVATIALEGKPEFSVSDGNGKVYVNLEDKSSIAVINSQSCKVEKTWPLSPGEEPTGLALDKANHRLISVCANKLMVITDSETGKVFTTLPIGERCDGVAFDPEQKVAFSSNGDKTMTVVREEKDGKYKVGENFPTQEGARTITVNRLTHHIYLSAADFEPQKDGQKAKILTGSFVVLDIVSK